MARIPVLPSSSSSAEVAATLKEEGCLIVNGLMQSTGCRAIAEELAPWLERADAGTSLNQTFEAVGVPDFLPGNTKRLTGLVAKSPTFRSLVMHPLTLGACETLLKPNCSSYQVHATAALVIGPGAPVQILHREDDAFQFFKVPRPDLIVASMLAVSDFSEANGATRIVPGSHRWPQGRTARGEEVAAAEMTAGSLLLWMGGTLHGAGANRSDRWRFGVFLSYSLGWLRQEENQYIDVPQELARTLPKEVRNLVGYRIHDPALGYASLPGKDPSDLLQ